MNTAKVIKAHNRSIKIVPLSEQKNFISENDAEMDARAVQAVKAAILKAEFCKKPVAKFNVKTKTAYVEYPDGRIVDVK